MRYLRPRLDQRKIQGLLGCKAEGNERYIESTATHAPSVSLVSAVVRGPFDVYQGWWVGPSAVSLRPDLCRRHLEAATWRLPERQAACDHSHAISDTTTPPTTTPPPLHHHQLTTTTAPPQLCTFAYPPIHHQAWSRRPRSSPRAKVPRADEQSATGC